MSVMDINKIGSENIDTALKVTDAEFTERTPEIIAAEICQIADQTRKMVLNNSIEIGKRLCEAKEMIPHGEWAEWLERSVNFKQSTANNLMKIYTEYGDIQGQLWGASAKSQTFGNLTYSKAVALLAVPAEEREEFTEKNDVENMSTRELKEAIKARDEALAAKEKAEEQMQTMQRKAEDALDAATKSWETEREKILKENTKISNDLEFANKKLEMEKELHDKLKNAAEFKNEKQEEEIERLKEQLAAAEAKSAEKPEAAQAEIKILKAKLEEAQKSAGDEEIVKFKIQFQNVQDEFYGLMDTVDKITDETAREKRKRAIKALLEQLIEETGKWKK